MKLTPMVMAIAMCTTAIAVWVGVVLFAGVIDQSATDAANALSAAGQENARRDADSAAIALAAATEEGRALLSTIVNKDALSLSNAVATAGKDAGLEFKITNVTQGPGPALPKGSSLHPASLSFALQASGSFQKLLIAAELLSSLPAASAVERIQFVRSSTEDVWNLSADVRIVTNSPI